MREVELKAVVTDWEMSCARLEGAGASPAFHGRLEDRRYDHTDRTLASRDEVLRLRVYRSGQLTRAELGWKGRTHEEHGYKVREELSATTTDAGALADILLRLGYVVTHAVDREIAQYELGGAAIRLERYPRMDDLIEVEGAPEEIERAIAVLGIPRAAFTSDRLRDFAARYEERTGNSAALSDDELAGTVHYRREDA
ncbi:MAG TPA: class IV adenylate cyclase [Gemmatimonadaceae bacterium]|nr:class IV adenylate cyclase [Gemmatimonadaceae bacterium]